MWPCRAVRGSDGLSSSPVWAEHVAVPLGQRAAIGQSAGCLLRRGALAVKKCPDAPLLAMGGTGVGLVGLGFGPALDGETVA
jgi:hypothetical protein